MNEIPFTVSIEKIKSLEEKDAVKIFKQLLFAETSCCNIHPTKIQITENTKEADGGIDATLNAIIPETAEGILKNGQVNYQIKADAAFSSLSDGIILKEFLGEGTVKFLKNLSAAETKKRLKPKIKETIEQGKYYVLVSFKTEAAGTKKQDAINFIKTILKKCGYNDPKVDIIDSTNLQLSINRHLSIVNRLTSKPNNIYNIFEVLQWERLNENFYITEELKEVKKILDNFLAGNSDYRHIRILGEPGTGKTKAILEFCKEYSATTIYIDSAENYENADLYTYLKDNKIACLTLIIDECDLFASQNIFHRLKNQVQNLKLITIYNDFKKDTSDTETCVIKFPKLTNEDFANILISEYNIDKAVAEHIASFCEGYPRLAHYIGRNFRNKQQVMSNLDDIMQGLIIGSEIPADKIEKTMCIMQYLSIFKKFGFSDEHKEEKKFIFELLKPEIPDLTYFELEKIINILKNKKILQQEHTLYISPKILHIWLYGKFWEEVSRKELILEKLQEFPTSLKIWFGDMFEYAKNALLSVDIPKEFLDKFEYDDFLNKERSDFFLKLTKANPKEALTTLIKIFQNLTKEQVLNITAGRMSLVWALQYILFDKELFIDSINILYKLAINENEKVFSNNATGIFKQIFHIYLPGTEASLKTRIELLQNLYNNYKTDEELLLLLKTFDSALHTHHFSRVGGIENQRFEIKMDYRPETYGEIFDYFEKILDNLLDCALNNEKKEYQNEAINIICNNANSLVQYSEFTKNLILNIFTKFSEEENTDKQFLYIEISKILQHFKYIKNSSLKQNIVEQFKAIKDALLEDKPKDTIETMFDVDIWAIAEDRKDAFDYFIKQLLKMYKKVSSSMSSEEQTTFLKTLINKKYKNDYYFGVMFAKHDSEFLLLDKIIEIYEISENKEGLFFIGYLSELYNYSDKKYNEIIKQLYERDLYDLIININSRGVTTNLSADLAFKCIQNNYVPNNKIKTFIYRTENISFNLTKKILNYSVLHPSLDTISTALGILYFNKEIWTSQNQKLIYNVLSKVVIQENNSVIALVDDSYIWTSVLKKYLDIFKDSDEIYILLDKFLSYIQSKNYQSSINSDYINQILNGCADINNHKTWNIIKNYLNIEMTLFTPLKEWLRGDDDFGHEILGAMALFNIDEIFSWIEEDFDERLIIIASCAPKDLFKGSSNIVRNLLVKYGNNPKLHHTLQVNYCNKGWIGKASENTKKDIADALQIKKEEKNANVLKFINEYIASLERELKREILEEERDY